MKYQIFEILIKNDAVTIERIISKDQQSSHWYDQKKNE